MKEAQPAATPTPELADAGDQDAIQRLNAKHAVVMRGGRTLVITEDYDHVLKRRVIKSSSFEDVRNRYLNERVQVGAYTDGSPKYLALGSYWLKHPDRRQYEGIVFSPGEDVPGHFNLWQGFSVEPKPGDWSLLQRHLLENVCRDIRALLDYVLGWMANGVQHPARPGEVALVLRGAPGVGKGIVAREFGGIFGQHFLHVAQARHLTGTFNAHLEDAVVVFADEAFGTGDKQAEAVLKALITEPTITIERKHHDATTARNVTHLIIASNQEWVVPVGLGDRRFCMLDVGDAHREDHAYFGAINTQMNSGGRAAMLYDLQQFDLSVVNVRKAPKTKALQEQQIYSMSPAYQWWLGKLMDGQVLPNDQAWVTVVRRDQLHADYTNAVSQPWRSPKATQTQLGMLLKKLLPGNYPRAVQPGGIRHWELPSLADARTHFEQLTGITFE